MLFNLGDHLQQVQQTFPQIGACRPEIGRCRNRLYLFGDVNPPPLGATGRSAHCSMENRETPIAMQRLRCFRASRDCLAGWDSADCSASREDWQMLHSRSHPPKIGLRRAVGCLGRDRNSDPSVSPWTRWRPCLP